MVKNFSRLVRGKACDGVDSSGIGMVMVTASGQTAGLVKDGAVQNLKEIVLDAANRGAAEDAGRSPRPILKRAEAHEDGTHRRRSRKAGSASAE